VSGVECYSGVCTKGVCQGAGLGADCTLNGNCADPFVCINDKCAVAIGPGAQCSNDTVSGCARGLYCNLASGAPNVCVPPFSLQNGAPSDNDILCASGRLYFPQGWPNGVCVDINWDLNGTPVEPTATFPPAYNWTCGIDGQARSSELVTIQVI
jgi:hypothetical protein